MIIDSNVRSTPHVARTNGSRALYERSGGVWIRQLLASRKGFLCHSDRRSFDRGSTLVGGGHSMKVDVYDSDEGLTELEGPQKQLKE
jgi:hypothetical protein